MDSDIEMDMESDNDGEYDDDYDYYNTGKWKLVPDLEGHFPLTTIGHRFNCGQIRGTSVSVRKYTHTCRALGLVIHLFGRRPARPGNLHSALDIRLGFHDQAPRPPFDLRPSSLTMKLKLWN